MTSAEAGIGVRAGVLPPQKTDIVVGSTRVSHVQLPCICLIQYLKIIMVLKQ